MVEIAPKLYQFSVYIPPMDFTIHQYLYAANPAILFAAGTFQQAEAVLPEVRQVLDSRELKYVFVSHMESDEAGGLSVWHRAFPEAKVVCGSLAARELPGWGYAGEVLPQVDQGVLDDGDLNLRFIAYPSEVHLQEGLLCYEQVSGILYSADLFLRFGNGMGKTVKASWDGEVAAIGAERVPNEAMLTKLQESLSALPPSLVAVGHGFCLDCSL